MRWIWIDKFVAFEPQKSGVAIKNCSLAEEHLHDLYPDFPVVPHSLLVEGMAQTAGLIVGEARQYREKVALAKVGKALFHQLVRPGDTILFRATIDQLNDQGASITGRVEFVRNLQTQLADAPENADLLVAEIELMFSHIDNNMSGIKFPEHNFVFSESSFTNLLENYKRDPGIKL